VITSLRIVHFKALADVTVPLGPITVLVGPNDSGKSTILQALMALSRAADQAGIEPEQLLSCPLAVAATHQDSSTPVEISADGTTSLGSTQQHHYRYRFGLATREKSIVREAIEWNGKELLQGISAEPLAGKILDWQQGRRTYLSMRASISSAADAQPRRIEAVASDLSATPLRLDPKAIASPSRLGAPLLDDGSGLVGIVDELLTSGVGDDQIARANDVIRTLTPHVKGVAARLHPSGGKELHFALRSGAVIPASQMSDGVVLAAALVLISLGARTPRLLIEEPENGLHPRQLRIVADTIRSIATEHSIQVVLTTHSPLLLNYFGAEETLLVTRTEAGVSVRPMSKTRSFDELAAEMSLGELWYNVGDADLARPA
jgi:ABC-type cobalamin/Fe3+-siderophores transport system ATPase subunit